MFEISGAWPLVDHSQSTRGMSSMSLVELAASGLRGPVGRFVFDHRVLGRVVMIASNVARDPNADKEELTRLLKLIAVLREGRGPEAGIQLLWALQDAEPVVEYLRSLQGRSQTDQRRETAQARLRGDGARYRAPMHGVRGEEGTIRLHQLRPGVAARSAMSRRMQR